MARGRKRGINWAFWRRERPVELTPLFKQSDQWCVRMEFKGLIPSGRWYFDTEAAAREHYETLRERWRSDTNLGFFEISVKADSGLSLIRLEEVRALQLIPPGKMVPA